MANTEETEIWHALARVAAEARRSREKFPGHRFMLAALVEEVGELAEALAIGDIKSARTEAIQVAATAIRILLEGDATTYQLDGFVQLVASVGGVARYLLQRRPVDVAFCVSMVTNTAGRLRYGDTTFNDITDEEAKP